MRWQPRQSQPTTPDCFWTRSSSCLTKCLPFLVVFSTVLRPLLSGYPDRPLLPPPSFLRHHPLHGGKAWSIRKARREWRFCFSQSSPRRQNMRNMTPSGTSTLEKCWKLLDHYGCRSVIKNLPRWIYFLLHLLFHHLKQFACWGIICLHLLRNSIKYIGLFHNPYCNEQYISSKFFDLSKSPTDIWRKY